MQVTLIHSAFLPGTARSMSPLGLEKKKALKSPELCDQILVGQTRNCVWGLCWVLWQTAHPAHCLLSVYFLLRATIFPFPVLHAGTWSHLFPVALGHPQRRRNASGAVLKRLQRRAEPLRLGDVKFAMLKLSRLNPSQRADPTLQQFILPDFIPVTTKAQQPFMKLHLLFIWRRVYLFPLFPSNLVWPCLIKSCFSEGDAPDAHLVSQQGRQTSSLLTKGCQQTGCETENTWRALRNPTRGWNCLREGWDKIFKPICGFLSAPSSPIHACKNPNNPRSSYRDLGRSQELLEAYLPHQNIWCLWLWTWYCPHKIQQ